MHFVLIGALHLCGANAAFVKLLRHGYNLFSFDDCEQ